MTAHNQPHKYRCETCAFRKDQEGKVHLAECHPHGSKITYNLYNIDFRRTSTLGCASHSDATKAEPHGRLKCPKCNGPVFIANIDDVDTILCYDDTCKWKQKIVAEPAERRIADVIVALEKEISALEGREPKLGTRMEYEMIGRCNSEADGIKYALAMLREKGEWGR